MKKLEKDYQAHLEAKAEAQDPLQRLKYENNHLRDVVGRLEHENEYLAQELVGSKIHLREEMDRVGHVVQYCLYIVQSYGLLL